MNDINIRGRYEDLVVLSLMSHITLRSGEDDYSAMTLRILNIDVAQGRITPHALSASSRTVST